jgi:N-acetylmuramic acid 6-phosphate etherase
VDPARDIDLIPTADLLALMNDAEQRAVAAVREVIPKVARCVDGIAARLRAGGRLHLFGAGTSGRLAVLDAAECPPTFGTPADLVQGHMAGGPGALVRAIEGAEDDEKAGAAAATGAGVASKDAVLAVTASGRTPWCLGVLGEASRIGAATYALSCRRPAPVHEAASLVIDPVIGDEVLLGSTRLSAGTAQKLVLNMISTGVMVRLGKTFGNLMSGVQATNQKLRTRAAAIVREITGRSDGIEAALEASGHDVPVACVMLARGVGREEAAAALAAAGSLRAAIAKAAR